MYRCALTSDIPLITKTGAPGLPWTTNGNSMQRSSISSPKSRRQTLSHDGRGDYRTPISEPSSSTQRSNPECGYCLVRVPKSPMESEARPSPPHRRWLYIHGWFEQTKPRLSRESWLFICVYLSRSIGSVPRLPERIEIQREKKCGMRKTLSTRQLSDHSHRQRTFFR